MTVKSLEENWFLRLIHLHSPSCMRHPNTKDSKVLSLCFPAFWHRGKSISDFLLVSRCSLRSSMLSLFPETDHFYYRALLEALSLLLLIAEELPPIFQETKPVHDFALTLQQFFCPLFWVVTEENQYLQFCKHALSSFHIVMLTQICQGSQHVHWAGCIYPLFCDGRRVGP